MNSRDVRRVKTACPTGWTRPARPCRDFLVRIRPLVEAHPDYVLLGSDRPHPSMEKVLSDEGLLVV